MKESDLYSIFEVSSVTLREGKAIQIHDMAIIDDKLNHPVIIGDKLELLDTEYFKKLFEEKQMTIDGVKVGHPHFSNTPVFMKTRSRKIDGIKKLKTGVLECGKC